MCGINGIFNFDGRPVDPLLLRKMTDIMSHRGPDGSGFFVQGPLGLGHRRLSIIDLDGGAQPISNEDDSLEVVFNGEIYNYIELRKGLKQKGHVFKTNSDTEVILHSYEEAGIDCVNSFNGIFAFALWDSRRNTLFLARDHLGIKPLYYVRVKNQLLFASEIKSLLVNPECPREVDIKALGSLFTFRYVPSPDTMFCNIKKIPPGHLLLANPDGLHVKKYWDRIPKHLTHCNESELICNYQDLLEDAIKLQLRSDVPVGLYLSSGIDSSAILALMRKHNSGPIHTFTIGFENGEKTNETGDAREIAQRFGTEHSEMIVSPKDYENYYTRYLWDLEEPVGNESAAAFYFVNLLASKKVKVALSGQGADEPWAGYPRYIGVKLSALYSRFPGFLTNGLIKNIVQALPRNERLKRGVESLNEKDMLTRFAKIYSFYSHSMKEQLFKPWVKDQLSTTGVAAQNALRSLQADVAHLDPLSQMLYIDTRANLPDDLLMVGDKTSMANSVESRVPFLDRRLVEFIEALPPHLKLRGFQGKYLHKKAVAKWLPKKMIYKPKKGFANPIASWLRIGMSSYVNECLLNKNSAVSSYFEGGYIKELLQRHSSGREDYLRHIYLLISFELWHRQFIRNAPTVS